MIDELKLRPWQIIPARAILKILENYDSALDSSDTGTGKTYTAIAVAKAMAVPCLVVCPKIAITSWKAVAEHHFNEPISIINYELLRTGNTLFGTWSGNAAMRAGRPVIYICCFCQRQYQQSEIGVFCPANSNGVCCVERKSRPKLYGHFRWDPAVKMVIFDEVHRCGGMNSLNSKMLIAAKRQHIKHLMLSATPAQNILQMKGLGYSLDLFTL